MTLASFNQKTTILVSKDIHRRLMEIKYAKGFRSLEEVIEYLLERYQDSGEARDVEVKVMFYIRKICEETPEGRFYLSLIVKKFKDVPPDVVEYIKSNNREVRCHEVLKAS